MMRDQMKKGDQMFFYPSNCKEPGIVGIMEMVKKGYPDRTAFDPDQKYYNSKSDPDDPRWHMVDVKYKRYLKRNITLHELKKLDEPRLEDLPLLRSGRHSLPDIDDLCQWWLAGVGRAGSSGRRKRRQIGQRV